MIIAKSGSDNFQATSGAMDKLREDLKAKEDMCNKLKSVAVKTKRELAEQKSKVSMIHCNYCRSHHRNKITQFQTQHMYMTVIYLQRLFYPMPGPTRATLFSSPEPKAHG